MLSERLVVPTPIYKEEISTATRERPELKKALEDLRADDVIVVWKLDRLGRSLADLVHFVNVIQGKGAGLHSLHDNRHNYSTRQTYISYLRRDCRV
jgi:DNA invertase Pin-like site-specific DNA recombinase